MLLFVARARCKRCYQRGSAKGRLVQAESEFRGSSADFEVMCSEARMRQASENLIDGWRVQDDVRQAVEAIYRADSRRILATLIRLLRDFELAEEGMHEAFASAVEQWSRDGIPSNPRLAGFGGSFQSH